MRFFVALLLRMTCRKMVSGWILVKLLIRSNIIAQSHPIYWVDFYNKAIHTDIHSSKLKRGILLITYARWLGFVNPTD